MLVIRTGIHIMLVRIGNRDDPAQTASFEAVCTRSYKTFFMRTKFILLINVKMPKIVGILTFISMINTTSERLKAKNSSFASILDFMSS